VKVLLQGAGISDIKVVDLPAGATTDDVITAAKANGLTSNADIQVWLEGRDEALAHGKLSELGVAERARLQVHTCLKIDVTVNFGANHPSKEFPPVTTVEKVKEWAVKQKDINMSDADAADHVLQVCDTTNRPDVDSHIGSLTQPGSCAICFDLVAKERIEGAA